MFADDLTATAPVVVTMIPSANHARERVMAMFIAIAAPIAIGPLEVSLFACVPSPLVLLPPPCVPLWLALVFPRSR